MTPRFKRQKYSDKTCLFELILENAGDVLWSYDFLEHRYTYASPSVFELRGFTPDEVEQQSLYNALTPDSAEKAQALVKQRIKSIQSGDLSARFGVDEFEQLRKDGSTVMTEVMTKFIIDENGNLTGIIGIARDITKRLQEEQRRKELEKRLHETQKHESIKRIVFGVAHEMNNTLMPVSGYAELLSQLFEKNDESLEYCHHISQSAYKATSLIDQLLDYTGSQFLKFKYVDLHQAVVDIEQLLRSSIRENILVTLNHDGSCPCVKMDLEKLRQIVFSLGFNAQDALPDGGSLIIDIKTITLDHNQAARLKMQEGNCAQLIISDNGEGIDPSVMPKIFDPFFTTKNFGMASGLGLSAIYGIVKQHYGNIEVNSTLGKGTSVSITLPLHQNHLIAPLDTDRETRASVNSHKTIMMVEDDEGVRNLLHQMLSLQKHTLLLASTPDQALELAQQHSGIIDLLITDMIMPGINGKMLADELKKRYSAMNIIFISVYINEIMDLPPKSHFIQKPFSFKELMHLVQRVFEH